MLPGRVIVFDVGKTLAKLSLWDMQGRLLEQRARPNRRVHAGDYLALDTDGIEAWLAQVLTEFAQLGPVAAIVPVGHGAAAAIVRDGRLVCPVPDYEEALSPGLRAAYDRGRDAFLHTGSPALPDGLNLGAQLHRLESLRPDALGGDAQILPWPQFWAWKLCGVAAAEVTSFGCHSDLWNPATAAPSALARARGWAQRFAPLRRAGDVLGTLDAAWSARTGLSPEVKILCGLHDSNAALLAARGFAEIAEREATVVSTGTWFVAMRTPGPGAAFDLAALPEPRDCLVNVDVHGRAVPSARFMGGRELEILGGMDAIEDQAAALAVLPAVVGAGAMVLPTWAPGVGPYPRGRGRWIAEPTTPAARRAALGLYAALVVDTSLELIGARERLLIEGRFVRAEVFVRALAALRPDTEIHVSSGHEGVPYGALRLIDPTLPPLVSLRRVEPLATDLAEYKTRWRLEAVRGEP